MDNLRCNRLNCRRPLADKAVVTTCSHIFCVDCANELFNAARLCPACETSLTEPDDVVVCSLHPSNDYKTSVLSGLNPTIILEICSRALSFWQYQVHQEFSFQHAVFRNVNDKNAQLQKQVEVVTREANGELQLLNNKVNDLERELELERRKSVSLQDEIRDRNKEYEKLKLTSVETQYDKIKRKTLLAPGMGAGDNNMQLGGAANLVSGRQALDEQSNRMRAGMAFGGGGAGMDMGAVVGGMEANGLQRTPMVARTASTTGGVWRQPQPVRQSLQPQRQPFTAAGDRSFTNRTASTMRSDHSENEVEALLGASARRADRTSFGPGTAWSAQGTPHVRNNTNRGQRRAFPQPPGNRPLGTSKFKPSGMSN